MGLGPIELPVTVTRVQDFSAIKHHEDVRPEVQQTGISQHNIKETEHKANYVQKKDEAGNEQRKQDAKEKGNNKYLGDGGKNRPGKSSKAEGTVIKLERAGFDFRI